jgi:arsenate reductase
MAEYTIYHNPRCSKSRQTLTILQEAGIEPEVVLYLENPPAASTLQDLLRKLGKSPRELLRKGEAEYKSLELTRTDLSDKAIVESMAAHPKLIERPIVVRGDRAVLGRPPENVRELID